MTAFPHRGLVIKAGRRLREHLHIAPRSLLVARVVGQRDRNRKGTLRLRENGILVFECSLCLSRACLGKKIVLAYKWLKKTVASLTVPLYSEPVQTSTEREGGMYCCVVKHPSF